MIGLVVVPCAGSVATGLSAVVAIRGVLCYGFDSTIVVLSTLCRVHFASCPPAVDLLL